MKTTILLNYIHSGINANIGLEGCLLGIHSYNREASAFFAFFIGTIVICYTSIKLQPLHANI